MGKTRTQTATQTLDPRSQGFVNQMRQQGQDAAGMVQNQPGSFFTGPQQQTIAQQIAPFMNPYMSNVVDATRGEFDFLRNQARLGVNDAATQAGAFGGARHGVAEGARMGELDRAQGSQIASLLQGGYNQALQMGLPYAEQQRLLQQQQLQEPLFRQQMAQGFLQGGLGPTGTQTTQTERGSALGTIAGLGMTAAGLFTGGAAPAVMGAFSSPYQGSSFTPPQFFPRGGIAGGYGVHPFFGG